MYNVFSRFWQWLPYHSSVHRHIPGNIQVPPFQQEGLHTAIGRKTKQNSVIGQQETFKPHYVHVVNWYALSTIQINIVLFASFPDLPPLNFSPFGFLFVFTIWTACLGLYPGSIWQTTRKRIGRPGILLWYFHQAYFRTMASIKNVGRNFNTITTILRAGKVSTYTALCQKILSKQPRYSASPALHVLVPANTSQFDSH